MSASHQAGITVTIVTAVLATGCFASSGSTGSWQREVDDLRLSVDRLREQQVDTTRRLDEVQDREATRDLEMEIVMMREQVEMLDTQVRSLAQRIQVSDERLGGVLYEIERLRARTETVAELATTALDPGTPEPYGPPSPAPGAAVPAAGGESPLPPAVSPQEDPAGLFQKAYADYSRGDYELAGLGFQGVLDHRPTGALADDAVYYLAEIAAAEGRVGDAVDGYARVERDYPGGDKVPAAMLKRGLLLIDANRIGEGVVLLDHLVGTHPESDEARLARNKLRALGVGSY